MTDNALLNREFDKFTTLATIDKEVPTEDDIDYFLDNFLSRNWYFNYEGVQLLCANTEDPETGEKPYDMTNKSKKEAIAELKPLLTKKVKDTYGSISQEANVFPFDTRPLTIKDFTQQRASEMGVSKDKWEEMSPQEKESHPARADAQVMARKIRSRILQYNEKVLPFMLRKTMHHPISILAYSQNKGPLPVRRLDENGDLVILNSEEDLQEFMSSKRYRDSGFPGAKDEGIRAIYWNPTTSGLDLKMAVIDIDNPAKLPKEKVREATRQIAIQMESQNHPYIIMFTGQNFQIWFGANSERDLGDLRDVQHYLGGLLHGIGEFKRQDALDKEAIHIDNIMFTKPTQPTRMFFSLHYPTDTSKKEFTGLSAIPVPLDDLMDFIPSDSAHPENVLDKFDLMASYVSSFFDQVRVGQDYEAEGETETDPPCIRLDELDKTHELLSLIDDKNNSIPVTIEDAAKKVGDEKFVYAYGKARGIDAVLKYNTKGGLKFSGTSLRRKIIRGNKEVTENVLSALITKNGTVIYSDYITRDLERYCNAKNIKEVTLVGQLTSSDYVGNEMDTEDVQAILAQKEGINPDEFRALRFVVNKIASFGGDIVPLQSMYEETIKIQTTRILSGPSINYNEPVGNKVKNFYKSIRDNRKGNQVIVIGDEKYHISSSKTISMAILGVAKQSRPFQQESPELGPVFVGVVKKSRAKGPIYYIAAKADIALPKEDRIKLKSLVYGENNKNKVPFFVREEEFFDQIEIVEPTVVVDVNYDDVSNKMTYAVPFHFKSPSKGKTQRSSYYEALERMAFITKIMGAKIVGVRPDLDARRESHISHKQDKLLNISHTQQRAGFSIIHALPNPLKKEDLYFYYDKRLKEEIDAKVPWKMSSDSYDKFIRLGKKKTLIGYVQEKRIIYEEADEITVLGNNDDFLGSPFTFKTITEPFKLRGIDIINATKMCVEYGINWHLVVHKNKFHWIYCQIENERILNLQQDAFDGEKRENIDTILSDLLHTVNTVYSPLLEVKEATIPGFEFDVLVVEKINKNPAFFGVPTNLDSWMSIKVDTQDIPEGEEPRNAKTTYGIVPVRYFGGRNVSPHLFKTHPQKKDVPGEFAKAYKRWEDGEEGYKVFVDTFSEQKKSKTPHYRTTSLPELFETAIDDPRGYGADGNKVVFSDKTLEPIKDSLGVISYKTQIDSHNLTDVEQKKEDLKILSDLYNYVPGGAKDVLDPDAHDKPIWSGSGLSAKYKVDYKIDNDKLKSVLSPTEFMHFSPAQDHLMLNPPLKIDSWNNLVEEYVEEHDKWEKEPSPKETWEKYNLGAFPTHLVPMLEKERLLLSASSQYSLSDDELRTVNETFTTPTTGEILESTLEDLYEELEEDDEYEEYEPDDSDFEFE